MSNLAAAGQLEVIFGPMFSGKTSELIRRIQRYHLANYRCLIVKHSQEKEFFTTATVISHDNHSLPAILVSNLLDVKEVIKDFDVIGIDEGHLFSGLIPFCESESDYGKRIIVAALDNCGEHIFKEVLGLIPFAESVTKLTAICMSCNNDATFTKSVLSNDEGPIGRQQKFVSVCGDCYHSSSHSWRSPFKEYFSSKTSSA